MLSYRIFCLVIFCLNCSVKVAHFNLDRDVRQHLGNNLIKYSGRKRLFAAFGWLVVGIVLVAAE